MAIFTASTRVDFLYLYDVAEYSTTEYLVNAQHFVATDRLLTINLFGENFAFDTSGGYPEITGIVKSIEFKFSDEDYFKITGANYEFLPSLEQTPYWETGFRTRDGETFFGLTGLMADVLAGNDVVKGSSFADRLYSFDGNDSVYGYGGNDLLYGGSGSDYLSGGNGNDTLDGGSNDDRLYGDAGDDVLTGGTGKDILNGGAGFDYANYSDQAAKVVVDLATGSAVRSEGGVDVADRLISIEGAFGSSGDDALTGNDADNLFRGGAGNDTIDGGGGRDWVDYSREDLGVTVSLVTGRGGNERGIDVLSNIENVRGSNYDDALTGDDGDNLLRGMRGNDTLDGGAGDWDWADYRDAAGRVVVDLSLTVAQNTISEGVDQLINIEALRGGAYDDVLKGNEKSNSLRGMRGDDTLDGGAGEDWADYRDAAGSVTVNLSLTQNQATGADGTDQLINIERISGSAFNDVLIGNQLDNMLRGNAGNDTIDGGDGIDIADYGQASGSVNVDLNRERDQATGADGTDQLESIENIRGSEFADLLIGNGEDNWINGLGGSDTIRGGDGFDWVSYVDSKAGVTVDLGQAVDGKTRVTQTEGETSVTDEIWEIEAIDGSKFADTLIGDSGNNIFRGREGADVINGGGGTDRVDYRQASGAVTVDLVAGTSSGADGNDTLTSIENIRGSLVYGDTLTGNSEANEIAGLGGNDTINGGGGKDTMIGGAGDDVYHVLSASDVIVEAAGEGVDMAFLKGAFTYTMANNLEHVIIGSSTNNTADTTAANVNGNRLSNNIKGNAANNTISGGNGKDTIDGGAGNDTASYIEKFMGVSVVLNGTTDAIVRVNGIAEDLIRNIENLVGGSGADNFTGDAQANRLLGNMGDDTLKGGGGSDFLDGGVGADTADYSEKTVSVSATLNGGVQASVTVGGVIEDQITNIENLTGGSGADTFTGDQLANVLVGNGGNDTLSGGSGNDTFIGGAGIDVIDGGADADTASFIDKSEAVTVALNGATSVTVRVGIVSEDQIRNIENLVGGSGADNFTGDALANLLIGNGGNDTLSGGLGSDTLIGGDGNDSLIGGDGADTLQGGGGSDNLNGGAGNDWFVFDTSVSNSNFDTITGFVTGSDKLVFDDDIFNAFASLGAPATGAAVAPTTFQLGTAANDLGDRLIYNSVSGELFYDADGSGAGAQVKIAALGAGTALAATDLLIIA